MCTAVQIHPIDLASHCTLPSYSPGAIWGASLNKHQHKWSRAQHYNLRRSNYSILWVEQCELAGTSAISYNVQCHWWLWQRSGCWAVQLIQSLAKAMKNQAWCDSNEWRSFTKWKPQHVLSYTAPRFPFWKWQFEPWPKVLHSTTK